MADELDDILTPGAEDIGKEELLKYLKGELSGEELHRVEKAMLDSKLMNDAVEGLQNVSDTQQIHLIQKDIDASLKQYLLRKNSKRPQRPIRGLYWVIVSLIVILLLIVVAFAVIYVERKTK